MSNRHDSSLIASQSLLSVDNVFNLFYDKVLETDSKNCSLWPFGGGEYLMIESENLGLDMDLEETPGKSTYKDTELELTLEKSVDQVSDLEGSREKSINEHSNSEVALEKSENKDSTTMTIEDSSLSTGADVLLLSEPLKTSVNQTDKNVRLSVPVTKMAPSTPTMARDKTSEVSFPSVRQLVHQFDAIVESKRSGSTELSSGSRPFDSGDYNINVRDIKFQFELYSVSGINKESSDYCDKRKVFLGDKKRTRTNSLQEESSSSQVCDESRRYSCIDNVLPKNVEGSHHTLRIKPPSPSEMFSLSDTDLRRNSDIPLLPRLDSGTSDLSLEGYSLSLSGSWTKRNTSCKVPQRRLSATPLSTSPVVSSSPDSVESFSLTRSLSCGTLSFYSDASRKRSNSSDSAVEVEEESRFVLDHEGRSVTSDLAQVDIPCQIESPYLSDNYWKKNLRLSSQSSMEGRLSSQSSMEGNNFESKIDKTGDVVLRDSAPSRRTHRTPSVVISDHSGHSVSVHVAYASEDFSLNKVLSSSSPDLAFDEFLCSRKASDCSSCSSISTLDTGSCVWTPGVPLLGSIAQRRLSDCSTCSYLTCSDEEEVEISLQQPSPPMLRKNSNWRKVRNVVQWTPFIQTYKRHKYPWVQLAGHQGNFKAGYKQGTIMKKLCQAEETAFEQIQNDVLKPYVPEYLGIVEGSDGEKYLQLQDLLSDFSSPCVMDIKMGVRTYLEEELAKARHKPKLRKDMFEKMIQIDSNAPTEAEQRAKAVTKPRYMVWRETISSTATLGFRIEGIRRGDGTSSKDFKTTRTREQVMTAVSGFIEGYPEAVVNYMQRLKEIKSTLEKSKFFKSHELIGSSLLFVHNDSKSNIWLIDFAKTVPLPDSVTIAHKVPWVEGTHEDGYLIGFDNLTDLIECLHRNPPGPKKPQAPQDVKSEDVNSNVQNTINHSHEQCNSTNTQEQRISDTIETHPDVKGEKKGPPGVREDEEISSLKSNSSSSNVTDVIERKLLNERKAN